MSAARRASISAAVKSRYFARARPTRASRRAATHGSGTPRSNSGSRKRARSEAIERSLKRHEIEAAGVADAVHHGDHHLAALLEVAKREVLGVIELVGETLRVGVLAAHVAADGEDVARTTDAEDVDSASPSARIAARLRPRYMSCVKALRFAARSMRTRRMPSATCCVEVRRSEVETVHRLPQRLARSDAGGNAADCSPRRLQRAPLASALQPTVV